MLGGFVDLAALGLAKPGVFSPFLGAAIGAACARDPPSGSTYRDLGEVLTPRGLGREEWHDGSRAPLPLDLAPMKSRQKAHGVRQSLRYAL